VLVDGDRVGRTALARALVRERWDVTVVDSEQDVAATLDTAFVDAAVVDTSHEAAHAILEALVRRNPHVVLVLRRAQSAKARIDMARLPAKRFDVISPDAPVQDIVRLVRRAVAPAS
jgi:DNA-binding NtrC family response regulator